MTDKRFLFLPYGAHPSHCYLVEALGASYFWGFEGYSCQEGPTNILGTVRHLSYVVQRKRITHILCEAFSVGVLLGVCRSTGFVCAGVRLGCFAADPAPYKIRFKEFGFLKRHYYVVGMRRLDFVVSVSGMVTSLLANLLRDKQTVVQVTAPMSPDRFAALEHVEPALGGRTLVFVGNVTDWRYKGLDLLLDVYEKLRATEHVELLVVGDISHVPQSLKRRLSQPGIRTPGRQDDIQPYLAQSCLCLHLGRGDACPVSAQEAMRAGIPTMVSEWTGAKEIVEKACPEFVVPLDSGEVVRRVKRYLSYPVDRRKALSVQFRQAMNDYEPQAIAAHFVNQMRGMAI